MVLDRVKPNKQCRARDTKLESWETQAGDQESSLTNIIGLKYAHLDLSKSVARDLSQKVRSQTRPRVIWTLKTWDWYFDEQETKEVSYTRKGLGHMVALPYLENVQLLWQSEEVGLKLIVIHKLVQEDYTEARESITKRFFLEPRIKIEMPRGKE